MWVGQGWGLVHVRANEVVAVGNVGGARVEPCSSVAM